MTWRTPFFVALSLALTLGCGGEEEIDSAQGTEACEATDSCDDDPEEGDEEEAREIFQRFDRDGSQELSLKELTTVVVSILTQLKKKLISAGANAEVRCTPLP